MQENDCFPSRLHPRIRGIDKVLETLGQDYSFHDAEVDEVRIGADGKVRLKIWAAPAYLKGEYTTVWTLHGCLVVDAVYDPSVCFLNELRVDESGPRLEVVLDGVGPVFQCDSIDVTISSYTSSRKRVFFDMDGVLVDFKSGIERLDESTLKEYEGRLDEVPGIFSLMDPMPGAVEAVHRLAAKYDVYILSTSPWNNPTAASYKFAWVKKYLGDVLHKRIIISHHKDLVMGDYLVDDRPKNGADAFEGEWICFGKEPFKDWKTVLDYLEA